MPDADPTDLWRLRGFNSAIRERDPRLAQESMDTARAEVSQFVPEERALDAGFQAEAIVLRKQRPVLAVRDNDAVLEFEDRADSAVWMQRLTAAKPLLHRASQAIGRIELQGSDYEWVGTGWLMREDVLVTNRHVAEAFVTRAGGELSFSMGAASRVSASVDFLQELGNHATSIFQLVEPLFVQPEPGPDVAFFRVAMTSGNGGLAAPIALGKPRETLNAAVIGYPAFDSRIPDIELMERIYGRIYNKKRLAPGGITQIDRERVLHDCTTLGGNSGSAVLDLDTGEAIGLHFGGWFLKTNYAVRADVVARLFASIRRRASAPPSRAEKPPTVSTGAPTAPADYVATSVASGRPAATVQPPSISLTIPLTLTVSLGNAWSSPSSVATAGVAGALAAPGVAVGARDVTQDRDGRGVDDPDWDGPGGEGDERQEEGEKEGGGEEGAAADYADRQGYDEDFLGVEARVAMPGFERHAHDVLQFPVGQESDAVLRYTHFSVVMSKTRRMCLCSATNIDGSLSRKSARVSWKWDPRIPRAQQIMNECYGNTPRFSRGHMTRREDPGWGDATTARQGNEDSMHVTNAVPQMQAFNSPIWLALEDYALDHAREDGMKISVFTGPYFSRKDPWMYGVRIPRAFWKVIAFIHDDTHALCASGYEMSQAASLPSLDEFVFGAFRSPQLSSATQVSIASIQRRSGIDFGELVALDALASSNEAVQPAGVRAPLTAMDQIRWKA